MTPREPTQPADPIGLVQEDPRWAALPLAALARRALHAALAAAGCQAGGHHIALLACDDARIAALNAQYRGRQGPTNVLSWPRWDLRPDAPGDPPLAPPPSPEDAPESLGDIALSWERVVAEAGDAGLRPCDHALHLLLHGALHLLGFDHETEADAARMETIESQTLVRLGLKDPYSSTGSRDGLLFRLET